MDRQADGQKYIKIHKCIKKSLNVAQTSVLLVPVPNPTHANGKFRKSIQHQTFDVWVDSEEYHTQIHSKPRLAPLIQLNLDTKVCWTKVELSRTSLKSQPNLVRSSYPSSAGLVFAMSGRHRKWMDSFLLA